LLINSEIYVRMIVDQKGMNSVQSGEYSHAVVRVSDNVTMLSFNYAILHLS